MRHSRVLVLVCFAWSALVLVSYYVNNADYYVAKVSAFLAFLKPVLGG